MSDFKAILIPALLALFLYLLITYIVLPLWRRHRARYAQYLPLHSALDFDNLSTSTSTLRARLTDALASFFIPSSVRDRWRRRQVVDGSGRSVSVGDHHDGSGDEDIIDEIEGESLVDLPGVESARREALEARRSELERIRRGEEFSDRRLSRDLEEGFMDSSDEEDHGEVEGRGNRAGIERWRNG